MEIKLQKAEVADAAALLTYLKRIGGESHYLLIDSEGLPYSVEEEENFLASFDKAPRQLMLLAKDGEKIVGCATLQGLGRPRIAHRCALAISVLAEYWGRGVGSALMQGLLDFARARDDIEIIELEVLSDNTRALALYEKFGFQKFGCYERFSKIDGKYFAADYMNLYLR